VCQGGEAKQASKTKSSKLVFFGLQQGLFSLSPQPIWVDSGGLGQISQSKDCRNNNSGNAGEVLNYG
jgi:hypothetical protein